MARMPRSMHKGTKEVTCPTPSTLGIRSLCFVDMPFGKNSDLASGIEIDLDQIYHAEIKPAVEDAGLEVLHTFPLEGFPLPALAAALSSANPVAVQSDARADNWKGMPRQPVFIASKLRPLTSPSASGNHRFV